MTEAVEASLSSINNDNNNHDSSSKETATKTHKVHRAALLERTSAKTMEEFVGAIKFATFKEHHPVIYKQDPKGLKAVYRQFVTDLKKKLEGECQCYFSEKHLLELLNGLDEVIHQQCETNPTSASPGHENAWRPSGNPDDDMKAHRISVKLQIKDALTEMLKEVQEEQIHLQTEISAKHNKLEEVEKEVDQKMMLFDRAATAAQQLPITEIRQYLLEHF